MPKCDFNKVTNAYGYLLLYISLCVKFNAFCMYLLKEAFILL